MIPVSKIRLVTYELKSKFAISFTKLVKWVVKLFLMTLFPAFPKETNRQGQDEAIFIVYLKSLILKEDSCEGF